MKTVEVVVTLRLTYNPNMDEEKDIRERVEGEVNTLLQRGQLEGCEHGAQIQSWSMNTSVTTII